MPTPNGGQSISRQVAPIPNSERESVAVGVPPPNAGRSSGSMRRPTPTVQQANRLSVLADPEPRTPDNPRAPSDSEQLAGRLSGASLNPERRMPDPTARPPKPTRASLHPEQKSLHSERRSARSAPGTSTLRSKTYDPPPARRRTSGNRLDSIQRQMLRTRNNPHGADAALGCDRHRPRRVSRRTFQRLV
jgi:hypothetical protein